jgi:hypothetical protein
VKPAQALNESVFCFANDAATVPLAVSNLGQASGQAIQSLESIKSQAELIRPAPRSMLHYFVREKVPVFHPLLSASACLGYPAWDRTGGGKRLIHRFETPGNQLQQGFEPQPDVEKLDHLLDGEPSLFVSWGELFNSDF